MERNATGLRLDDALRGRLDKIASDEGRSRSDVIRRLLIEALDARSREAQAER
jgi:predicted transcriptional regulator